ncbi:MAG: T9SS type A sorting domain-containing protein [Candidatus Cloacimonetes bacterium]|nr:T9SS type A sorting domain-containing protein [Candidatus Cloacimonadota bacterium]
MNLDIGSMFAVGTGIAGGVCISDAFVPGTWTICGTAQNTIIWGVELCLGDEPWISVNPISGTVPAGDFVIVDVTLNATDLIDITKTADIVIANNAGDDVIVPVTMEVTGTATLEVPTNVSVDPDLGLLTWDPPAGVAIYSDDFESYTVGEYLAVQSADWTTWSNNPGSAEDALISDVQALSGSNSVVVEGTTDLVLIMDNYTSGVYSMDLNLFVPTGYCGYWNLQKTSTPGQEWAFQIMFDVTGIATADAGAAAAFSFPFSFDTWINMELIVDLDADLCEIWVDGVMLHDYQWTLGTFGTPGLLSFGGMNLYAWASAGNSPLCYFDDIELNEITRDTRDLISYNVYLDDMGTVLANVGTDVFEYLYSGLINGEDYIAGVSAVYDAGESDIVQYPFTYTGVSADNIVNITTALRGNYPNPFNPVTNIAFSLGEATHVTLEVYNVKGEKVKTLVDKVLEANNHVITWDGRNNTNKSVASGIYFYKMKAEKYTATKKMILMK